jgi:hypothetical protein
MPAREQQGQLIAHRFVPSVPRLTPQGFSLSCSIRSEARSAGADANCKAELGTSNYEQGALRDYRLSLDRAGWRRELRVRELLVPVFPSRLCALA